MAKKDKKFSISDTLKSLAQGEGEFDYDEIGGDDEMTDYSGKSSKSINVIFMKEENEYKKITECIKRGSVCIVNVSALSKEDATKTIHRIEGVLDAVKGTKELVAKDVYALLPSTFAVRILNELDVTSNQSN